MIAVKNTTSTEIVDVGFQPSRSGFIDRANGYQSCSVYLSEWLSSCDVADFLGRNSSFLKKNVSPLVLFSERSF